MGEEGEEVVLRKKEHMGVNGDNWLYGSSCLNNCATWRCLRYQNSCSML